LPIENYLYFLKIGLGVSLFFY